MRVWGGEWNLGHHPLPGWTPSLLLRRRVCLQKAHMSLPAPHMQLCANGVLQRLAALNPHSKRAMIHGSSLRDVLTKELSSHSHISCSVACPSPSRRSPSSDLNVPVMNSGDVDSPHVLLFVNLFLEPEISDYCVFAGEKPAAFALNFQGHFPACDKSPKPARLIPLGWTCVSSPARM